MNDNCKMYELQEDMGYKPVCEDSKNRIYLSLVRTDAERELRAIEVRRNRHKKRIIRALTYATAEVIKFAAAIGSSQLLLHFASAYLLRWRGYEGVGSEYIFCGMFGVAVWLFIDYLFYGDDHWSTK